MLMMRVRIRPFAGDGMFKIEGLDALQKQLKQAEKAFAELDGDIAMLGLIRTIRRASSRPFSR